MSDQRAAPTYSSYLGLDEVLGAQRPRTPEHDELLFIVIHHVYELWFKQLLHEGTHLQDGDTTHALHTLKRMLTILKTVVAQIDVLETMTPASSSPSTTASRPPAASNQRSSASSRPSSAAATHADWRPTTPTRPSTHGSPQRWRARRCSTRSCGIWPTRATRLGGPRSTAT
jgi:tryptophan 2,3-dioxygenase